MSTPAWAGTVERDFGSRFAGRGFGSASACGMCIDSSSSEESSSQAMAWLSRVLPCPRGMAEPDEIRRRAEAVGLLLEGEEELPGRLRAVSRTDDEASGGIDEAGVQRPSLAGADLIVPCDDIGATDSRLTGGPRWLLVTCRVGVIGGEAELVHSPILERRSWFRKSLRSSRISSLTRF